MKTISAILAGLVLAAGAEAQCTGVGINASCLDPATGDHYYVNRIPGVTTLEGNNTRTGSRWSQQSTTIGSQTWSDGRSSDGARWQTHSIRIGSQTWTTGTDSQGQRIDCTSNRFGVDCR